MTFIHQLNAEIRRQGGRVKQHRQDPMARAGNDLAGTLFDSPGRDEETQRRRDEVCEGQPAGGRSLPATSRAAWEGKKKTLSDSEARVLRALLDAPRAIFQVAEKLGVPAHTISGRFGSKNGLADQGLITVVRDRHAITHAGYKAEIWALTAAGLEAIAAREEGRAVTSG